MLQDDSRDDVDGLDEHDLTRASDMDDSRPIYSSLLVANDVALDQDEPMEEES